MAWKSTVPWIVGAVSTAGLAFVAHAFKRKELRLDHGQTVPLDLDATDADLPEVDVIELDPREEWDPPPADVLRLLQSLDDELRAEDDAARDIGEEFWVERDTLRDPGEIDVERGSGTVHTAVHPHAEEQRYDALDAEEIGREWLLRATQSATPEGWSPEDNLEGTHEIRVLWDDARGESGFGADQAAEALGLRGDAADDVARELPVGSVDTEGNVKLRPPPEQPDALSAPPTGELSLTPEELARRTAVDPNRPGH